MSASQNLKKNRFLSFDNFTETVRVPTNYVSLAILLFCMFRHIGDILDRGHGEHSDFVRALVFKF